MVPVVCPRLIRFGVFEVDLGSGELFKGGHKVRIEEQPFQVLSILLEKPGQLVTRKELQQRLWPQDTFVDFEHSLNVDIQRLRRVLGDSAENPRYIETLLRRGYRFIYPLERLPLDTPPPIPSPSPNSMAGLSSSLIRPPASLPEAEEKLPKPAQVEVPAVQVALEISPPEGPVVEESREAEGLSVVDLWMRTVLAQFSRNAGRWGLWLAGSLAVLLVGLTVTWWSGRRPAPPPELVPLTSYAGWELYPSFSPDGNQVAFSWNGEKQDNFDIYVKLIGSPTPLRLTTDPAADVRPAFSPDGRTIGFVRESKEHATFIVIPAIGGPERRVAEVTRTQGPMAAWSMFAWFPDGKWVVTDGLALLSTETGETRSLTFPPSAASPDFFPAVSPDGRTIAFSRSASLWVSDIYLLELTEDMRPRGEPRRLTSLNGFNSGSAWTPDGREIIFTRTVLGSGGSLWRVPASGATEPERLPFSAGEAFFPAISRRGNRLAYHRVTGDLNIWRLPLSGPAVASGPPVRIIASTRADSAPQYSPDGKRIACESDRSGIRGIWISDADGSNAVELFSRTGASYGSPRWSPDGQRIAADFEAQGNLDIHVIPASGGNPIPLTTDPADDLSPSWSRDGKWVYFTSNRTGRYEIWKVPAGGGEAIQVTLNGGETAFESPDGKSVYFTKAFRSSGLWKMPVSGGEESQVLPSVVARAFFLVNEGIYFIPAPGADGKSSIQFMSFATGKVKTVAPISRPPTEGLSVSPDGRFILFSQLDEAGSDLMLVENFR